MKNKRINKGFLLLISLVFIFGLFITLINFKADPAWPYELVGENNKIKLAFQRAFKIVKPDPNDDTTFRAVFYEREINQVLTDVNYVTITSSCEMSASYSSEQDDQQNNYNLNYLEVDATSLDNCTFRLTPTLGEGEFGLRDLRSETYVNYNGKQSLSDYMPYLDLIVNKNDAVVMEYDIQDNYYHIHFGGTVNGDVTKTVSFNMDNITVVGTLSNITGGDFDGGELISSSLSVRPNLTITLDENYNSETMELFVSGEDYNQVLAVDNGVATLTGLEFPNRAVLQLRYKDNNPSQGINLTRGHIVLEFDHNTDSDGEICYKFSGAEEFTCQSVGAGNAEVSIPNNATSVTFKVIEPSNSMVSLLSLENLEGQLNSQELDPSGDIRTALLSSNGYLINISNSASEGYKLIAEFRQNSGGNPNPGPSNEFNTQNGKLALVFDDHSDRYHNGKICYKIGSGTKTCLTESDYVDISSITNGTVTISVELGNDTELDTGHMELMNNSNTPQNLFNNLNLDSFMANGYVLNITDGQNEGYRALFEFRYYGERPVQIGKTVISSDGSGNGSIIWTSQGAVGNVNHNEVELNNNEGYTLNIKLNFDDNEARIRRFEIKKGNVQNNVFVDWITSATTNTAAMAAALTPEGYNLNVNAGDTYLIEAIFDSLYEMMTFRNATAIMNGDNVVGAKYENVNVDGYSATISLKGYNNDGTEVAYENQPDELRFMFSSQKLGGAYLVPEFSECKEGNNNVSCDEFANRVALVYRDLNILPYKYGNDNFYTIRIPETYGETTFNGAAFDENSFVSKYLSAYYVWMCGENDSKVCFHKFENLYNREAIVDIDGFTQVDFKVTYIKDTDITNQNDNGVNENFTFTNKMTNDGMWLDQNQVDNEGNVIRNAGPETLSNWVLAKDFRIENEVPVNYGMEEDNGDLRDDLTRTVIFGPDNCDEYDQQCRDDRGIQLNPVGGKIGKYSVSTNGDRNFRATIYKDGYVGLSFNASIRDFTYFPSFWDTVFFDPSVEISGSTKENAAVYSTYLLEPTLQIKKTTATTRAIESITALDVNPDAVTITKNGDTFYVVFNSKYYDHVVLEIKDSEYAGASENDKPNHIYYLRVSRDILDVYRRDSKIIGTLYYPVKKDENHEFDYTDFDIIATINYKDGTTKVVNATPALENSSIGGDMIEAYRFKGGNNLYASTYGVDYNSNIESVYFNVLEKDALNGNAYGGTFSGSDKGYEWRNQ